MPKILSSESKGRVIRIVLRMSLFWAFIALSLWRPCQAEPLPVLVPDVSLSEARVVWERQGDFLLVEVRDTQGFRLEKLSFSPQRRQVLYRSRFQNKIVSYPEPGLALLTYPLWENQASFIGPVDFQDILQIDLLSGRLHELIPELAPAIWPAGMPELESHYYLTFEKSLSPLSPDAEAFPFSLQVYDLLAGKLVSRLPWPKGASSPQIHETFLASFIYEPQHLRNQYLVWDLESGRLLARRQFSHSEADFACLCTWLLPGKPLQGVSVRLAGSQELEFTRCDVLTGKTLARYRLPTSFGDIASPQSYTFEDQGLLYILHRDGRIQSYDIMTGKPVSMLLQLKDLLQRWNFQDVEPWDLPFMANHPAKNLLTRLHDRVEVIEDEGLLYVRTIPYPLDTPEDAWRRLSLVLDLRSGHFMMPGSEVVQLRENGIVEVEYDINKIMRLPRQQIHDFASYSKMYSELEIYCFPDAVLLLNRKGQYAGFGNYQQSLRFERNGSPVSWQEMEACCHRSDAIWQHVSNF